MNLPPNVYPDRHSRNGFEIHDYVKHWQLWIGPLLESGQFWSKPEDD